MGSDLALRQGWKILPVTNNLAYLASSTVKKKKKFYKIVNRWRTVRTANAQVKTCQLKWQLIVHFYSTWKRYEFFTFYSFTLKVSIDHDMKTLQFLLFNFFLIKNMILFILLSKDTLNQHDFVLILKINKERLLKLPKDLSSATPVLETIMCIETNL